MKITESFGKYFEELEAGVVIVHRPAKTITESDNNLFCLLTMNHHPLHLDIEYVKKYRISLDEVTFHRYLIKINPALFQTCFFAWAF